MLLYCLFLFLIQHYNLNKKWLKEINFYETYRHCCSLISSSIASNSSSCTGSVCNLADCFSPLKLPPLSSLDTCSCSHSCLSLSTFCSFFILFSLHCKISWCRSWIRAFAICTWRCCNVNSKNSTSIPASPLWIFFLIWVSNKANSWWVLSCNISLFCFANRDI